MVRLKHQQTALAHENPIKAATATRMGTAMDPVGQDKQPTFFDFSN